MGAAPVLLAGCCAALTAQTRRHTDELPLGFSHFIGRVFRL